MASEHPGGACVAGRRAAEAQYPFCDGRFALSFAICAASCLVRCSGNSGRDAVGNACGCHRFVDFGDYESVLVISMYLLRHSLLSYQVWYLY